MIGILLQWIITSLGSSLLHLPHRLHAFLGAVWPWQQRLLLSDSWLLWLLLLWLFLLSRFLRLFECVLWCSCLGVEQRLCGRCGYQVFCEYQGQLYDDIDIFGGECSLREGEECSE